VNFKAIILLYRRADATHEQFVQWWLGQHQPLARQLPKLRKGVFNVVESPDDGEPDGVSELWFDSQADFEAAYAGEIGQQVVADSMANVSIFKGTVATENDILD